MQCSPSRVPRIEQENRLWPLEVLRDLYVLAPCPFSWDSASKGNWEEIRNHCLLIPKAVQDQKGQACLFLPLIKWFFLTPPASWLRLTMGLPWWRSGWESACQCGGHGFEPWSGKIPRAAERLGPWATTAELARLEPVLRNRRGCDGERPAHRGEEWPPLAATGESPRTETRTQHRQK